MAKRDSQGFVLVTMLLMTAILTTLLAAHFSSMKLELKMAKSTGDMNTGYFAAEAGLNIRAAAVKTILDSGGTPSGSALDPAKTPCKSGNNGSGDYACQTISFGGQSVTTYVLPDSANPRTIVVPPGEFGAGLEAKESVYTVWAMAQNPLAKGPSAMLGMRFRVQFIRSEQFSVFSAHDLEFDANGPGQSFTDLSTGAPVLGKNIFTSQGNKFFNATASAKLYQGEKNSTPPGVSARYWTGASGAGGYMAALTKMPLTGPVRVGKLGRYNSKVQELTAFTTDTSGPPVPGDTAKCEYNESDWRIAVVLNASEIPTNLIWFNKDGTIDAARTAVLKACPGTYPGGRAYKWMTGYKDMSLNAGAGGFRKVIAFKWRELAECIQNSGISPRSLNDSTGLIVYITIIGPNSNTCNDYTVLIDDIADIDPTSGSVDIGSVSLVTDQTLWIKGPANVSPSTDRLTVEGDRVEFVSSNFTEAVSAMPLSSRVGADTVIHASVDTCQKLTGGVDGIALGGAYQGGAGALLGIGHENFTGKTQTFIGSIRHSCIPKTNCSDFGDRETVDPIRVWKHDGNLNNSGSQTRCPKGATVIKVDHFTRSYAQVESVSVPSGGGGMSGI